MHVSYTAVTNVFSVSVLVAHYSILFHLRALSSMALYEKQYTNLTGVTMETQKADSSHQYFEREELISSLVPVPSKHSFHALHVFSLGVNG